MRDPCFARNSAATAKRTSRVFALIWMPTSRKVSFIGNRLPDFYSGARRASSFRARSQAQMTGFAVLPLERGGIPAAPQHQFVMGAVFDERSLAEHQDLVGVGDSCEPMADDNDRGVGLRADTLQRLPKLSFVFRIELAGRLIQD